MEEGIGGINCDGGKKSRVWDLFSKCSHQIKSLLLHCSLYPECPLSLVDLVPWHPSGFRWSPQTRCLGHSTWQSDPCYYLPLWRLYHRRQLYGDLRTFQLYISPIWFFISTRARMLVNLLTSLHTQRMVWSSFSVNCWMNGWIGTLKTQSWKLISASTKQISCETKIPSLCDKAVSLCPPQIGKEKSVRNIYMSHLKVLMMWHKSESGVSLLTSPIHFPESTDVVPALNPNPGGWK